MLVGVLSDTHGLLRAEVIQKFSDCDLIIHAGDVGKSSVLAELRKIAGVVAVRGNMDAGNWAAGLKESESLVLHGKKICVLHDISRLKPDVASRGVDIVIYGHSHKPGIGYKNGILYLNPGSAGPKRFHLPVSIAFLIITDQEVAPEIVELSV